MDYQRASRTTMSKTEDHVQALERELAKLRSDLATINYHRKKLKRSDHALSRHFSKVSNRHDKLTRAYEKHKEEMFLAVVSGNTALAASAEAKLRGVIEEQARLQRELPDQYKYWAEAVREKTKFAEKRREWQSKIELKEEEIHRLKPCFSMACQHCKRIDTAGLDKAKVVIMNGLNRMLGVNEI